MTAETLPVLYSFRRCPYAMRARLALAATGMSVELREVVLRDKPQAMLEASPKATVPVLVLPDSTVIDESVTIMRHALAMTDPEGWMPDDPAVQAEIDRMIDANDGPFKRALDRYKYPNRYGSESIDPVEQRSIGAAFLADYEKRLAHHPWLLGDEPTLADFALLPFMRQFAHVDRDWFYAQPWPGVIGWLDRFLASDRFAAIMAKHPQWQPGDAPTVFPATAAQSGL